MNLEPTDEQLALRDAVRRCLAGEAGVAEHVRPIADGATWAKDAAWKRLAELGATGLLVADAHGGSGLGMREAAIVAEEAGRALYPGPWLATAVAAARVLATVPPGPAAGELLAAVAAGATTAAVALPGVDRAGAALAPSFRVESGRLHGAEAHVLGAPAADVVLVPTGSGDDVELHAVEVGADGVTVGSDAAVDRTVVRGPVVLDGARATSLGRLGAAGLDSARDDVLVAIGADSLGCAEALLAIAVEYAKVRHQFDQPIGAFQAVQHLCVDMYETVELARGGVLHAAWAADAADPRTRRLAAQRLKAFSDRLATVGGTAIQVLGGIGFTWEHDAHLFLKRLLTWSGAFGPASDHRVALGRALAGSAP